MSEPTKENPKTSKRSRRKPAMEPLGWDEIVSQPGMGGYLSFLNGPIPLPHLGQAPAVETTPGLDTSRPVAADAVARDMTSGAGSIPGTEPISANTVAGGVGTAPGIEPDATPLPTSPAGLAETPGVRHLRLETDPGSDTAPGLGPISGTAPVGGDETAPGDQDAATPPLASNAGVETSPGANRPFAPSPPRSMPSPEPQPTPGDGRPLAHSPARPLAPPAPEVISIPVVPPGPRLRIRKCLAAQDGHSLGEEVLYQALWKTATPESGETRTIVIGWRGMSQICRMTPKNCKINTQRLIRKLALEVLSPYNTPESIGTTYRVYASDAILRRRRSAGLEWVVRSRGVEFVDPATGIMHPAHLCGYVSD